MFIAVAEYENFRCFIHVNAVKLFSVKNKKNEQNANEDDLFPYVLHNLTNFTKLAEIFFYLSNYITIHLYLYNFEFFLQNLKGTEEEVPQIPTTELDPNREQTFILFTHVDRKNSYTAKHVIRFKTKVKITCTAIRMSILYGV